MTMTNEKLAKAVARLTTINVVRGRDIDDMQLIIRQLWAEREDMEKEMLEQCRIIGAGGERELSLIGKVERYERLLAKAREALRSCNLFAGCEREYDEQAVEEALAALESVGV